MKNSAPKNWNTLIEQAREASGPKVEVRLAVLKQIRQMRVDPTPSLSSFIAEMVGQRGIRFALGGLYGMSLLSTIAIVRVWRDIEPLLNWY